jgi:hypothetical protein
MIADESHAPQHRHWRAFQHHVFDISRVKKADICSFDAPAEI